MANYPAFISFLIPHKLNKLVHKTFAVCFDHDGKSNVDTKQ